MEATMAVASGRSTNFGKADLHIHTAHGDGMASGAELLDYVEEHTDLSIIGIVDHDDFDGALATYKAWAKGRYSFELIVGTEVTTREGHVLALGTDQPIASFKLLEYTVQQVHEAGGFCIVPHPLSWLTRSVGRRGIDRILASTDPLIYFDGIEVVNQSPAGKVTSARADDLNGRFWQLPRTGGSDAHYLQAIGTAYTIFAGHTTDEFRSALMSGSTEVGQTSYPTLREIGYTQVVRQLGRGLMVTPRNVLLRPLARRLKRSRA